MRPIFAYISLSIYNTPWNRLIILYVSLDIILYKIDFEPLRVSWGFLGSSWRPLWPFAWPLGAAWDLLGARGVSLRSEHHFAVKSIRWFDIPRWGERRSGYQQLSGPRAVWSLLGDLGGRSRAQVYLTATKTWFWRSRGATVQVANNSAGPASG
jgi:hypothetical protein